MPGSPLAFRVSIECIHSPEEQPCISAPYYACPGPCSIELATNILIGRPVAYWNHGTPDLESRAPVQMNPQQFRRAHPGHVDSGLERQLGSVYNRQWLGVCRIDSVPVRQFADEG